MKDFGLYVSLEPDGKIKRDLANSAGKVSLPETTIQEDLITFSELNYKPYAEVVDLLRTTADFIMAQDEGHYGEIDMSVFQFFVDTAKDLITTLVSESPLHGTLLQTEIEDAIPEDDGSGIYPLCASQDMLTILTAIMQFQFVVNDMLYDLSEGLTLDNEEYEGLWEFPVREILTRDSNVRRKYHFRSATDYYHFLFLHFISTKPNVALCQCCGRYFIPKTKKKTLYCDRILKDNKTCKHWGPILKHKLESNHKKIIEEFDRAKRRMFKRYERTADGKQNPSEKDLSYADYYRWLDAATKARDNCLAGNLDLKKALEIINVP